MKFGLYLKKWHVILSDKFTNASIRYTCRYCSTSHYHTDLQTILNRPVACTYYYTPLIKHACNVVYIVQDGLGMWEFENVWRKIYIRLKNVGKISRYLINKIWKKRKLCWYFLWYTIIGEAHRTCHIFLSTETPLNTLTPVLLFVDIKYSLTKMSMPA